MSGASRREVLSGLAVAAAAGAVPAAALASKPDPTAWNALIRKEQALQAESARVGASCDVAEKEFERVRPSLDMIDWNEFRYADRDHVARVLDIDEHEKWRLESEGQLWWSRDPAATRAKIREACNTVRRFRELEAKADRETGREALNKRYDAISDKLANVHRALMRMPAPNGEALHWKLMNVCGPQDCIYEPDYVAQFYVDADRMLKAGRA